MIFTLDTNQDTILNQKDFILYIKQESVQRLGQMIANKLKEFSEIAFDMKIRKAGAMDFTMSIETIESLIQAATSKDYQKWLKNQDIDKTINYHVKDEL